MDVYRQGIKQFTKASCTSKLVVKVSMERKHNAQTLLDVKGVNGSLPSSHITLMHVLFDING